MVARHQHHERLLGHHPVFQIDVRFDMEKGHTREIWVITLEAGCLLRRNGMQSTLFQRYLAVQWSVNWIGSQP